MVKAKKHKKKRRKVSDAWKNLKKLHRKGPKRVKLDNPRKKNGVDPLTVRKNIKIIRIIVNDDEKKNLTVVVFNRVFQELGLSTEKTYTMKRNRLTRAGACLKRVFDIFDHNAFITKAQRELKLDNIVGRCLVFAEHFKTFDTILHINPTEEEEESQESTAEYVKRLFEHKTPSRQSDVEVEFM